MRHRRVYPQSSCISAEPGRPKSARRAPNAPNGTGGAAVVLAFIGQKLRVVHRRQFLALSITKHLHNTGSQEPDPTFTPPLCPGLGIGTASRSASSPTNSTSWLPRPPVSTRLAPAMARWRAHHLDLQAVGCHAIRTRWSEVNSPFAKQSSASR